jgi:hypothetical protein
MRGLLREPASHESLVWFLARHGFRFHSIGVQYPTTLAEAEEFVSKYSSHARPVDPALWEQIDPGAKRWWVRGLAAEPGRHAHTE